MDKKWGEMALAMWLQNEKALLIIINFAPNIFF